MKIAAMNFRKSISLLASLLLGSWSPCFAEAVNHLHGKTVLLQQCDDHIESESTFNTGQIEELPFYPLDQLTLYDLIGKSRKELNAWLQNLGSLQIKTEFELSQNTEAVWMRSQGAYRMAAMLKWDNGKVVAASNPPIFGKSQKFYSKDEALIEACSFHDAYVVELEDKYLGLGTNFKPRTTSPKRKAEFIGKNLHRAKYLEIAGKGKDAQECRAQAQIALDALNKERNQLSKGQWYSLEHPSGSTRSLRSAIQQSFPDLSLSGTVRISETRKLELLTKYGYRFVRSRKGHFSPKGVAAAVADQDVSMAAQDFSDLVVIWFSMAMEDTVVYLPEYLDRPAQFWYDCLQELRSRLPDSERNTYFRNASKAAGHG